MYKFYLHIGRDVVAQAVYRLGYVLDDRVSVSGRGNYGPTPYPIQWVWRLSAHGKAARV